MLTVDFRSCKKSWDSLTRKCFACFRPIRTRTRYVNEEDSESARNCKYYSNMSSEEQSETLKVAIAYCNESWKRRVGSGRKSASMGNGLDEREGRSVSVDCFSWHDCPTSFAYRNRMEEIKAKNCQKKSLNLALEIKTDSDGHRRRRMHKEEVKFLQNQQEKKSEVAAIQTMVKASCNRCFGGLVRKGNEKNKCDLETDVVALQDRIHQEADVMVKDSNMCRQIEQEWAKKRGCENPERQFNVKREIAEGRFTKWNRGNQVENAPKVSEHLEVKRLNPQESWE